MNLIKNMLGPESKHDKTLPYTYEARRQLVDGHELYNSYLADTICGLVDYLRDNDISPEEVTLFEIYQAQEFPIKTEFCTTSEGNWLARPYICRSFKEHYKGHIEEGKCSFRDRNRQGCGP